MLTQLGQKSTSKYALVTGATRGIGAAVVRRLASEGYHLALVARSGKDLDETARALRESDCPGAFVAEGDVTSEAAVAGVQNLVAKAWSRLDLLINIAGSYIEAPIEDTTSEQFDELMGANARGMFLTTKAFLPMLRQSRGHIINMGSRSGVLGLANETAFCASKYAVAGFSAALRVELKGSGVRVSCLHPGPTNTWGAEDPHGLLTPEDVAAVVALIASQRAEFYDVRFEVPE